MDEAPFYMAQGTPDSYCQQVCHREINLVTVSVECQYWFSALFPLENGASSCLL